MNDNRYLIMFYDLKSLTKITFENYNFIEFNDEIFDSTKINELTIKERIEIKLE
jgi:hypothetical protein